MNCSLISNEGILISQVWDCSRVLWWLLNHACSNEAKNSETWKSGLTQIAFLLEMQVYLNEYDKAHTCSAVPHDLLRKTNWNHQVGDTRHRCWKSRLGMQFLYIKGIAEHIYIFPLVI
jgi:hypothetical protein